MLRHFCPVQGQEFGGQWKGFDGFGGGGASAFLGADWGRGDAGGEHGWSGWSSWRLSGDGSTRWKHLICVSTFGVMLFQNSFSFGYSGTLLIQAQRTNIFLTW